MTFAKRCFADKPVVAAINGYALGAGAEMACSCGLHIYGEDGKKSVFPKVQHWYLMSAAGDQFSAAFVGLAKADEHLQPALNDGPEAGVLAWRLSFGIADDALL